MTTTLILGGARSGKSTYAQRTAESRAAASHASLVMIATAEALDAEMAERIARHKSERGSVWQTIEEPMELAATIASLGADQIAVVDCLTLWLSNLMTRDIPIEKAVSDLISALRSSPAEIILVSNEVGLGIVPDNPLARRFRDEAGRLNQSAAQVADEVVFIAAGLPMTLKSDPPPQRGRS